MEDDLDPAASTEIIDANVADLLANLLVDVPVPPAVRAAAFRALAEMPNVTTSGPARDDLDRAGIGIRIRIGDGRDFFVVGSPGIRPHRVTGQLTRELTIDPDTSQVLASQIAAGDGNDPIVESLIVQVGWGDAGPHEPKLPALQ